MRCFQPFSKIFWKQGEKGPIRRGNIAIGLVVQFFIQPNPAPPLNKLLLEVSSGDKSHKTMLITSTKTAKNAVAILELDGTERRQICLLMEAKSGKHACLHSYLPTQRNEQKEHRLRHPIILVILMEQLYMSCHDQNMGENNELTNSQPKFNTQF